MRYSDCTVESCAKYFDISRIDAATIAYEAVRCYAVGRKGEPLPAEYADDASEEAELYKDAWHDGITEKTRLVVRLSSRECQDWNRDDPEHAHCENCGGTMRDSTVLAKVSGPYAHEWAEWDQCIAGSSWECAGDMPDFAYAMPGDHPGLVEELRKEGYTLDLSEYYFADDA